MKIPEAIGLEESSGYSVTGYLKIKMRRVLSFTSIY